MCIGSGEGEGVVCIGGGSQWWATWRDVEASRGGHKGAILDLEGREDGMELDKGIMKSSRMLLLPLWQLGDMMCSSAAPAAASTP